MHKAATDINSKRFPISRIYKLHRPASASDNQDTTIRWCSTRLLAWSPKPALWFTKDPVCK